MAHSEITPNLGKSDSDHPDIPEPFFNTDVKAWGVRLRRDSRTNWPGWRTAKLCGRLTKRRRFAFYPLSAFCGCYRAHCLRLPGGECANLAAGGS